MTVRETAVDLAARLGHERVIVIHDPASGLRSVIAIHSSALGPAVGGTRMRAYPSFDAAVEDALLLSRAMTYKAAYAGMHFGGAKAVIDADSSRPDRRKLLAAHARAVHELEGRFVTGGDMGVSMDDVRFMSQFSSAFEHAPAGAGPDASDLTAIGVAAAIRAAADRIGRPLAGLRVAIQGAGEVGGRLAVLLAEAGSRVTLADVVVERAAAAAKASGASVAAPEQILAAECDILSPNAAGGVFDSRSIAALRCAAVCGAANNQLATPEAGDELDRRGILFAPDFVASAGGVLSLLFEQGKLDIAGTIARVERIGDDLEELFAAAARERIAPFRLAERRVDEKLAAMRAAG